MNERLLSGKQAYRLSNWFEASNLTLSEWRAQYLARYGVDSLIRLTATQADELWATLQERKEEGR